MGISQGDRERIHAWLKSKVRNACPMCGTKKWDTLDDIGITGTIELANKKVNPATGVPVVQEVCTNCGFVATYSARLIGLV